MKKMLLSKIITNIAYAFFFTAIFVLLYSYILDEHVDSYITLVNKRSGSVTNEVRNPEYNFESKHLIKYPAYGSKYATLKISKIDKELPLYYGDTLKILRYGIGQYAGSYFPGENGTIILAGHNTAAYFKRLDELVKGDEIVIEASYGTFKYIVDRADVVKETDYDAFKVSHDKESLIMYTCYPMNRRVVGRRTKRYVVYAYKEGDTSE